MTPTPTAREELTAAADRLEAQMQAATQMPWRPGLPCDAVVGPADSDMDEDATSTWYGGPVLAESMSAANRDLILTFGRLGAPLVAVIRAIADSFGPDEVLDGDCDEPDEVALRALLDAVLAPSEMSA